MSVLPRRTTAFPNSNFLADTETGSLPEVLTHPDVPLVRPAAYFRWQPAMAWCLAVIMSPIVLPLTVFLVLLVRLTSPGPGLYRQLRVGKNGKLFWIYKIRTMYCDAEKETGPVWTAENDPRITPVGRMLRRFHLDELPQLLNVLKGEMTLIGPRPERPEFAQVLAKAIPGYLQRCAVLPGITGLAQINLPPDSDLDSVRRKLVLDLEYIERGNFWLDARIFLCTALKLVGLPGLRIARWLGLTRTVRVPDWMRHGAISDTNIPKTYTDAVSHSVSGPHNGHRRPFPMRWTPVRKPR
ncbi:sugar transferase [Thermogutta sp.]|uniref:sugar transferase n=1 Tax=Thermogutta sp. TaxID=1962930 RepID=UPI0032203C0F